LATETTPIATRKRLPVLGSRERIVAPPRPDWFDAVPASIEDTRGRRVTYVRLSVTDRCDLACVYCMPPAGENDHARREELLSFEETARIVGLLARSGVQRVRFTGGEPLVRRDVVSLIARTADAAPEVALAMTTNATRLAELARPLRDAGLQSVNVSLDSLEPHRFAEVTRGGDVRGVLAGIHMALDVGMSVKLNTVLLGEAALDEAEALVRWAWSFGITPRFIELMPIGEGAGLPASDFVPASRLLDRLSTLVAPERSDGSASHGPARYLRARDGSGGRVGLITAMSDEFCDGCNRMRLTARGDVRPCLGSPEGVSLLEALRAGASDVELAWLVHSALRTKAAGHGFADPERSSHHRVGMSLVGG
jgi:GTP 3',8-cyclase